MLRKTEIVRAIDTRSLASLQKLSDIYYEESYDSPLHLCCRARWLAGTQLLLERGMNPNILSYGGYTPLHTACTLVDGVTPIIKALVSGGADVTILNTEGLSVVALAARYQAYAALHTIIDLSKSVLSEKQIREAKIELAYQMVAMCGRSGHPRESSRNHYYNALDCLDLLASVVPEDWSASILASGILDKDLRAKLKSLKAKT